MRSADLQMASITDPVMHVAVVYLQTTLLGDLRPVPEFPVRLCIYAISSICLDAVLANLYVRSSFAELTTRTLLASCLDMSPARLLHCNIAATAATSQSAVVIVKNKLLLLNSICAYIASFIP